MESITAKDHEGLRRAYTGHPRRFQGNRYVYPVLSRRAGGVSVGINLNPDRVCNFNCVYCQVQRPGPAGALVDMDILGSELRSMLTIAVSGGLPGLPPFGDLPAEMAVLRDVAFSGDGEPTASPRFPEAVRMAVRLKAEAGLDQIPIRVLTNGVFLHRLEIRETMAFLYQHQGELWIKLDAGDAKAYARINRSASGGYGRVLQNILDTALARPVVIQSCFFRFADQLPSSYHVKTYVERLCYLMRKGAQIAEVQIYTVARQPAEPGAVPLPSQELMKIADEVRKQTGLVVKSFPAASP